MKHAFGEITLAFNKNVPLVPHVEELLWMAINSINTC